MAALLTVFTYLGHGALCVTGLVSIPLGVVILVLVTCVSAATHADRRPASGVKTSCSCYARGDPTRLDSFINYGVTASSHLYKQRYQRFHGTVSTSNSYGRTKSRTLVYGPRAVSKFGVRVNFPTMAPISSY